MTQAVILAGGLGTRLQPVSKDVPKPMVRIAGTPYLQHQLRVLAGQSIRDVVLLTGHLGDQIESYFGDGRELGLHIHYSRETTPLGTGGALRQAAPLLHDAFLLLYGDSYLPIDYHSVLNKLRLHSAVGCLAAYDNRLADTSVTNNLAIDADGVIVRYAKDCPDDVGLQYVEAGVHAYHRRVLDLIPEMGKSSLEQDVFPRMIARRELIALQTDMRFYDIGTPERLSVIQSILMNSVENAGPCLRSDNHDGERAEPCYGEST